MALVTDYTTLQTAIGSWKKNRTDLPTDQLVDFAERDLFDNLILRDSETDSALTGNVGSRFIALPSGFIEPRALFINITGSGRFELEQTSAEMETSEAPGQPRFWAIDGENVAFERPCDQAYSFSLRALMSLAALSDLNPSNWLLANRPDLYLAGCEVQAALWLQDADWLGMWQPRYDAALAVVNQGAARSKSGQALRVDPALTRAGRGYGWNINTDS